MHEETKRFLIVIHLIFGVLLFPWIFIAFSTIFIFDAPGSTESLSKLSLAYSIWSYPIFYGIAIRASINLYKRQVYPRLIYIVALTPILNLLWFGLSWIWIDINQ